MEIADYSAPFGPLIQRTAASLIEPLAHGGERASLHVGVVFGDMGGDVYEGLGCEPGEGFDGRLQVPTPEWMDCTASEDRFQRVEAPEDVEGAAHAIGCSQYPGTDRCVAQGFEAMLKALTPATSALRFRGNPGGHADEANAGFLRDDALLAILFVGAHDDCSLADLRHVEPGAPRCAAGGVCCPDRLLPLDRYLHGLASVGSRHIIVNAIAGIPGDSRPAPGDRGEIEAVLSRPEMARPETPLCRGPFEDAWPSRRIVELVGACPGVVRSVCDPVLWESGSSDTMGEIGSFLAREACHVE